MPLHSEGRALTVTWAARNPHLEGSSMESQIKLSKGVQELLRCPICKTRLNMMPDHLVCLNSKCGVQFPLIDGVPVLLNEQASLFSIDDFVSRRSTTVNLRGSRIKKTLQRLIPSSSANIKGESNYATFASLLTSQVSTPRILIIGGRILGQGMNSLVSNSSLELVETDVSFGPRTMLICDAHDIPFEDGSFNGVVAQAVLDDLVDPQRCVEEIHRVLKTHGLVYAETPFMQQVHGGRYDFTRFTHLGHRRLFRRFDEIDSGAVCGPGMALAWSYEHFLLSFTRTRALRDLIKAFARLTSFYLIFFDNYLIDKAGTLDAASGVYFMGRKENHILSDRELIRLYRGAADPEN